ncbi:SMP-30/gluconolactonase/LRE family protein [Maribellus sediminis]|uniref:SMP-30/gluconolactonase/LRE family protein n=1 Tax=Maribellus sediminis TaxID=2696285 RepID=UPI00143123CB|nr:lactonase family protein [Maribellus sediminis]
MKKLFLISMVVLLFGCGEESLTPAEGIPESTKSTSLMIFPEILQLPNGFQPEGIVIGNSHQFYVGSIVTGNIYKGDIQTGEGEIFITPPFQSQAGGLAFDPRSSYLFVANGMMGAGSVINTQTGEIVHSLNFTTPGTAFINDVTVTSSAAYFTNSFAPVIYKVLLEKNGQLTNPVQVMQINLSGEFSTIPNPMVPHLGVFSNGIDASPNGKFLLVASTDRGEIYRVDPNTGEAVLLDLGGTLLPLADGILLDGKTLFVVQNLLNVVAVIELNDELDSGSLAKTITSLDFGIPTTIAEFGNCLYAVNAHFDLAPPGGIYPDVEFEVVRVSK